MRRTVLVVFCIALLAAVGMAFTRGIAARIPEQRATLEKLIADRTGLAVRFDNVHFAWGLDGTSAVFEHVELNDPARGRVRVVAPELRVEFDTWDFLRHQQFSLGRVTIHSPDIDIIGDPEPEPALAGRGAGAPTSGARLVSAKEDERALVRRFTSWAELMPIGRVEVESARVHLLRRGERVARHHITLSQAVVSRGSHDLNAFGTMLLSQDIGQSLFISAKLADLGSAGGVSGDVRVIARRVLLDKLPAPHVTPAGRGPLATRGRGTLDATLQLEHGRVTTGSWQMSARELELPSGKRFDHFTVNGNLRRSGDNLLLEFDDLQVTRAARLERSPRLAAELSFEPGTLRVARARIDAARVPFMAAELIAGALAPTLEQYADALPEDWRANAGELREVMFDSRDRRFTARVEGAEITRALDQARISRFAAAVSVADGALTLQFDPANAVQITLPRVAPAQTVSRTFNLAGALSVREVADAPELLFTALSVTSGDAMLLANGPWSGEAQAKPLSLEVTRVDRAMLGDVWSLLALDSMMPQLADVQRGEIVSGRLGLMPLVDDAGQRSVNWQRSRGTLTLAALASAIEGRPALTDARGTLEFSRTGTQLRLAGGNIDDLRLSEARIDWPYKGAPRLRASLQGPLESMLLQRVFHDQGLEKLKGSVSLEADARGEEELRQPEKWRITAKLADASIPLAADIPDIERLSGTVRYANGELRGLALEGTWLGGPVQMESRRATRGGWVAELTGTAESASLLQLLGHPDAATQVSGATDWTGTLNRESGADAWRVSVASNLSGIESRLPEPFAKPRARLLPLTATLLIDARGLREYEIESGRDSLRGRMEQGRVLARFDVRGITGEFRGAADAGDEPRLAVQRIELRRAPLLLAAAGALLPPGGDLRLDIADLRQAENALGAMTASLSRRDSGIEFSVDSAPDTPHQLSANGLCLSQEQHCRMDFTVNTRQLPALLEGATLPPEWPVSSLRASGELRWRSGATRDLARELSGQFDLETQGEDSHHQLVANATLEAGQIELTNVQGGGPQPDQLFRGQGRVSLLARTYDLSVDYEQVSLAAAAVPSPARNRIVRAWTVIRGSAAQRGWTEPAPARRVQWHGSWDAP